ncbi:MAG: hypothetical protein AABZ17_00965 [Nitrospirota bacterium]
MADTYPNTDHPAQALLFLRGTPRVSGLGITAHPGTPLDWLAVFRQPV